MVYKAYLRTLKVDVLRKVGGPAQMALEKNVAAIRAMQASEGLTIIDGNDDFVSHSYTFAGLAEVIDQNAGRVCGALQMLKVRLLGESPGGLEASGEGELRIWYDGIHKEQEAKLRRGLGVAFDLLYRSEVGNEPPASFSRASS